MDRSTFSELRRRIGYPQAAVPAERNWYALDPGYAPVEYTARSAPALAPETGTGGGGGDPQEAWRRAVALSQAPVLFRDPGSGRPLNPAGPTGIRGHGRLRSLGPNPTGDAVAVFGTGQRALVLLVVRRDTGQPAFPGGFSEPLAAGGFEHPLQTALRELWEETGVIVRGGTARLLHRGVAAGSLRNTDNAWIENSAFVFRLPPGPCGPPAARAADDARAVRWTPLAEALAAPGRDLMSETHAANLERLAGVLRADPS